MKWLLLIASVGLLQGCAHIHITNDPEMKEIGYEAIQDITDSDRLYSEVQRSNREDQ